MDSDHLHRRAAEDGDESTAADARTQTGLGPPRAKATRFRGISRGARRFLRPRSRRACREAAWPSPRDSPARRRPGSDPYPPENITARSRNKSTKPVNSASEPIGNASATTGICNALPMCSRAALDVRSFLVEVRDESDAAESLFLSPSPKLLQLDLHLAARRQYHHGPVDGVQRLTTLVEEVRRIRACRRSSARASSTARGEAPSRCSRDVASLRTRNRTARSRHRPGPGGSPCRPRIATRPQVKSCQRLLARSWPRCGSWSHLRSTSRPCPPFQLVGGHRFRS